jgi:hypothetical protein
MKPAPNTRTETNPAIRLRLRAGINWRGVVYPTRSAMIALIKASAFRSDEGGSTPLTPEGCQEYLAQYASSKVRLWAYHCSLSRLVLRIGRQARESIRPIDLEFVSVLDIRCPVH